MRCWLLTTLLLIAGSASAQAQFSGQAAQNNNALPNFYNRQSQPLSPYLNLTRGGNQAVNYFYGVRPGTAAGGYLGLNGNAGNQFQAQTFFPYVDNLGSSDGSIPAVGMRPTGHPAGFNNPLGYFSTGVTGNTQQNRQGQGQQQQPFRPGAGVK